MTELPTLQDIEDAARRIEKHIEQTPLLESEELNARTGGRILLKAECLQRTGSFKMRGATNRLLKLSDEEKINGVVAWSSGNHAQGVAAAAQVVGTTAKIVMPSDAPKAKIENTQKLDATVVFYDRSREDRYAIAKQIAADENRTMVPPYDDPNIIAGQGTVGLSLIQQAKDIGVSLDDVLVPVSGGGLIAGVGLAIKGLSPSTKVISVEPAGFDDHKRSLASGKRETNSEVSGSICDALLAPTPGTLTWALNRHQIDLGYAVSEEDALAAIAFAHNHIDLTLEPGGAVALAAVLNGTQPCQGRKVAVVLSGGNVDKDIFNLALANNQDG